MPGCPWDTQCGAAPAQIILVMAFQYKVLKALDLLFKGRKIDTAFLVCVAPCISERFFSKRPATDIFPVSSSASLEDTAGS